MRGAYWIMTFGPDGGYRSNYIELLPWFPDVLWPDGWALLAIRDMRKQDLNAPSLWFWSKSANFIWSPFDDSVRLERVDFQEWFTRFGQDVPREEVDDKETFPVASTASGEPRSFSGTYSARVGHLCGGAAAIQETP